MNIEWLAGKDANFHKDRYREFAAMRSVCNTLHLKGYAQVMQARMDWLLSFGKIPKTDATAIEVDVQASQAQVNEALKEHLAKLGT